METIVDFEEECKRNKYSIYEDSLEEIRRKWFDGAIVKKIIWDEQGGFPEYAWGFVQYTLRPYKQGYGCDGTTDKNIHRIAMVMCEREGWSYTDLHLKTYGEPMDGVWLEEILSETVGKETVIPEENSAETWAMALNDLYQINKRDLEETLEAMVLERYPETRNYLD